MIRIVAISGSPVKDGNTERLLQEALSPIGFNLEVRSEIFNLSGLEIKSCQHCNWCVKKQTPEQFCAIADGMGPIYFALLQSEVILLATPVHIGRMSGLMANMIDRMRVFVYGNLYRERLKDKVGGALILGFLRHGGLETTLQAINNTFALFHMIAVGPGGLVLTSQDGTGRVTKGVRHMALEDQQGVASAKEVVRRAVEIAQIIQAGKRALKISCPQCTGLEGLHLRE